MFYSSKSGFLIQEFGSLEGVGDVRKNNSPEVKITLLRIYTYINSVGIVYEKLLKMTDNIKSTCVNYFYCYIQHSLYVCVIR